MLQLFADVMLIATGQYDRRRREWDRKAAQLAHDVDTRTPVQAIRNHAL